MPNLRHVYVAAYPYLTTTVTFNRIPVFTESEAADIVLRAIFFGKKQQWYYLLSFVIMPDHMHLIIIPRDKDISQCMKSIKGFSARQINEVFSRKGALWQSGFYDYILDSEEKVLSRIRYVEGNPVRKGMVGCPEGYRYISVRYRDETDLGKFF